MMIEKHNTPSEKHPAGERWVNSLPADALSAGNRKNFGDQAGTLRDIPPTVPRDTKNILSLRDTIHRIFGK